MYPEFKEFPKMLTNGTDAKVVNDPAEEADLVSQGYKAPESARGPEAEKAKPCASCEALRARVAELEAKTSVATDEDKAKIDALKAKIADLTAQKDAGTLPQTGGAQLARAQSALAALEGK